MSKVIDLTGQRFGKLIVINKAEDIISKSGKTKNAAWLCKCDCGNEIVVRNTTLKTQTHIIRSCGCSNENSPKHQEKHMSEQDKDNWNMLYEYVKKNIMGYDDNQSLSKNMVLRLKGLLTNKFIANNNTADTANYSYQVVLNAFKFSIADIQKGLRSNSFKDENHKFAYVLKIVESNLNTVYMRMKNAEKVKEEVNNIDTSISTYKGAEYKPETKTTKDRFSDLW